MLSRVILLVPVVLLLAPVSASRALAEALTVAWIRHADYSLWAADASALDQPRLLYGHHVGRLCPIASPDGEHLAAQIIPSGPPAIFSITEPGRRHTMPVQGIDGYWFLSEWSKDGRGLLVGQASAELDLDGVHEGVHAVYGDGERTLVARPATPRLLPAYYARYSPRRERLLVLSDQWLQVVDTKTHQTLLFLCHDSGELTTPPVWLDDDVFIYGCRDSIRRGSVSSRKVAPWILRRNTKSLTHAPSIGQLFALVEADGGEGGSIFAIDARTGRHRQVPLPHLESLMELFGVTSDGGSALVLARDPEYVSPSTGTPGTYGLWLVNLDDGGRRLVTEGAIEGVLIEHQ